MHTSQIKVFYILDFLFLIMDCLGQFKDIRENEIPFPAYMQFVTNIPTARYL